MDQKDDRAEGGGGSSDPDSRTPAASFWDILGCKLESAGGEGVVISLLVQEKHMNHLGLLHGGVTASVMDSAMGHAAALARPDGIVVTTGLQVHYLAAVHGGALTMHAAVLHSSRRLVTVTAEMKDAGGRLCAYGTGTFRVLEAAPARSEPGAGQRAQGAPERDAGQRAQGAPEPMPEAARQLRQEAKGLVIRDEIEKLVLRINGNPAPIRNLSAVYEFRFGETEALQVRFHGGAVELLEGTPLVPDCRLSMKEETLRKLIKQRTTAMAAYAAGDLKMDGKMTVAFRLQEVLKSYLQR